MNEYPMNLTEFEKEFSTEEQCREYLFKLRWENGYMCPRCNCDKAWQISEGKYKCHNCGYQTTVIAGTIFQDTHKPLTLWFRAIWWVTAQKNGASALGLQKILGLGSYRTAWTWLHKLRRAMVRPGRDKLSGYVEVDDAYIGGKSEGKRGRGSENKVPIAVAVEINGEKIGRIRISRISNASGESLLGFVQDSIEKGSTVNTDGWQGYSGLSGAGYIHEVTIAKHVKKSEILPHVCLLYTSDAADDLLCVDLGGRR